MGRLTAIGANLVSMISAMRGPVRAISGCLGGCLAARWLCRVCLLQVAEDGPRRLRKRACVVVAC